MRVWLCFIAIVWIIVIIWCVVEEIKYAKIIKKYNEVVEKFNKVVEEYEKEYGNNDNNWK